MNLAKKLRGNLIFLGFIGFRGEVAQNTNKFSQSLRPSPALQFRKTSTGVFMLKPAMELEAFC